MKTHKFLTRETHQKECPKWNFKNKTEKYCGTMVCACCLIFVRTTITGGYITYSCDIDKLD